MMPQITVRLPSGRLLVSDERFAGGAALVHDENRVARTGLHAVQRREMTFPFGVPSRQSMGCTDMRILYPHIVGVFFR